MRIRELNQVACFLALALLGCSVNLPAPSSNDGGEAGSVLGDSETYATQSWPLDDGAGLKARLVAIPIDEYSVATSLIVEHTYSPGSQAPLERFSMQFADSPGWKEIPVRETIESGQTATQVYEMPFSAPIPWTMEFQCVKGGVTLETPLSFTVTEEDIPDD